MFPDQTAMPDDYLSAREPSEFEYDSEEMDPGEPEDDPEEDDASISSNSMYQSNGMILIGPVGPTYQTVIIDVTRESGRSTDSDIPQILRRRKIGIKAKWSCLCSGSP